MIEYKYQVITKSGDVMDGEIEAMNKAEAVRTLKESCKIVLKLEEKGAKRFNFLSMDLGGNKLNAKAFVMMCTQFSIILRSGVPIGRAVQLVAQKLADKTLKNLLEKVSADVESGISVAGSFEAHGSKLLPVTFLETLRAGEESGNIDGAFANMAKHYENDLKIKGKIKSALSYPAFVIVIAIVVVIILMVKVVPTFVSVFDGYGADLPLMTRILISMSDFFSGYWWVLLAVAVAAFAGYKIYTSTEKGKENMAKLMLKLPILGNIQLLGSASEFASTMNSLVGAGLPITKAIGITAKVIGNIYVGRHVGDIKAKLESGESLGSCLNDVEEFPPILVDMVSVGEETGELEDTLQTVSNYYESELDSAVTSALNKLEPAVLVFIAGFAGFIVIAIYMAMFEMYSVM